MKCKQPRRTARPRRARAAAAASRGRSRNRSTVTCGSHGRCSRSVDARARSRPLLQSLGEGRRPPALVVEGEHPDAARLAVAADAEPQVVAAPAAAARSAAAIAGSSPAGRLPRNASVTWRFAGGTIRSPAGARRPRSSRCCQRTSVSDRVVGEPESAEEPKPFIAVHASAQRVTCLSQLCDKFAHEVERGDRRPRAHRLAVAGRR